MMSLALNYAAYWKFGPAEKPYLLACLGCSKLWTLKQCLAKRHEESDHADRGVYGYAMGKRWSSARQAGIDWALRPGRYEPRAKKRRPKQFDLMRVPRAEMRKRLREKDLAA